MLTSWRLAVFRQTFVVILITVQFCIALQILSYLLHIPPISPFFEFIVAKKTIFTVPENETLLSAVFHIPIHARCIGHDKICVLEVFFIFLILYFVTCSRTLRDPPNLEDHPSSSVCCWLLVVNVKLSASEIK